MNPSLERRLLGKTGMNVSVLSFGASSLGGVFHEINESEGIETVHAALEGGINFIDVSPYYGNTKAETVLGKALCGVDRSSYYLATKVGQYGESEFDFSAQRSRQSVQESMDRIGVEYLDLIQCHDIEFVDVGVIINETLPALHQMKSSGLVRHVGITGLPLRVLRKVLDQVGDGEVETILSFCHYSLNDIILAGELDHFAMRGVGVINAAPTSMGLLTPQGPPPWHPAGPELRACCASAAEACQARGLDIARLAIQFALAEPRIATTLVSTAKPSRIRENIAHALAPLDPEEMKFVEGLLQPARKMILTRGRPENQDHASEGGGRC